MRLFGLLGLVFLLYACSAAPSRDTAGAPASPSAPASTRASRAPAAGVSFTWISPGRPGQLASAIVQTTPADTCLLAFVAPELAHRATLGFTPKQADHQGQVSWTWQISPTMPAGTGRVQATCGAGMASGSLTISP
ncbi:MAG: hypothetical protein ACRDHX_07680 [Chloroflexota bacterium]